MLRYSMSVCVFFSLFPFLFSPSLYLHPHPPPSLSLSPPSSHCARIHALVKGNLSLSVCVCVCVCVCACVCVYITGPRCVLRTSLLSGTGTVHTPGYKTIISNPSKAASLSLSLSLFCTHTHTHTHTHTQKHTWLSCTVHMA